MEHQLSSSSYTEAYDKFAEWVAAKEELLASTCHCRPGASSSSTELSKRNGTLAAPSKPTVLSSTPLSNGGTGGSSFFESIVSYHQKLQEEIEGCGERLNCELRQHLEEDKACTKQHWDQSSALENRWHHLWLVSLEQLVIVERNRRCPTHKPAPRGGPTPASAALNQSLGAPPPTATCNGNGVGAGGAPRAQVAAAKKASASPRKRPISYPNSAYSDRLEWDYKNTLSLTGCHKENGSHIDLDSVDEQATKNLTEFGENYELWFGKEDEIALLDLHSRPPSVEPSEKPVVAKAIIITPNNSTNSNNSTNDVNCNLLMLTTPSSIFSVDASKCSHHEKTPASYRWRLFGAFLFAVAALLFSSLYTEPHHIHKSYYHSQPPV